MFPGLLEMICSCLVSSRRLRTSTGVFEPLFDCFFLLRSLPFLPKELSSDSELSNSRFTFDLLSSTLLLRERFPVPLEELPLPFLLGFLVGSGVLGAKRGGGVSIVSPSAISARTGSFSSSSSSSEYCAGAGLGDFVVPKSGAGLGFDLTGGSGADGRLATFYRVRLHDI